MNDNEVLLKRVLRVFRNTIVQHTRERLNGKYAADAETKLAALFAKKDPSSGMTQWERMRLNAERARASLEVSTIVIDGFELLGVSDFFGIFEKFHDDLTIAPAAGVAPEVLAERRKGLLRCLQQIKVFRDPNAHEVTESVDNDSLQLCIINCKLVCGELGLAAARQALDDLHKELTTATLTKYATVIRVSDETVDSDFGSRCLSLSGAEFETLHYREFGRIGGAAKAVGDMQNCVVVVASAKPNALTQDEIDALNEVFIACTRHGRSPILLMSQALTEAHVEQALETASLPVFKKAEKLPLVPAYEDSIASKLYRLMRPGVASRVRSAYVHPVPTAQAVHDDKLAPMIFSMMKDPQLTTVRIVAPFATDMSFGALGQISAAMIGAKKQGCRVCLVTRPPSSKDNDAGERGRLLKLLHAEEIELYVNPKLHSKVYLFEREGNRNFWAVGSHNMTSFAHNGESLETSMVGYRSQEFDEAQTSYERARRHSATLNFDAWASQQMRANSQPSRG